MPLPVKTIELNDEFRKALRLMEKTNRNILITGRAGTGKSTLLEYFVRNTKKSVAVLAPTGVAAVNVGGQTIHSFFGFKPDITLDKVRKKYDPLYKEINALVVDEISMVRADLFDCVNKFLRLNGKDPQKSFGGVQMILIGDLYQLPPVVTSKEKEVFRTYYQSPYFFDAHSFNRNNIEFIELEKIYRQKEQGFINLLNAIRNKSVTEQDLAEINRRFFPSFQPPAGKLYINLTTTNALADSINADELSKLPGEGRTFKGRLKGNFERSHLPTEENLQLKEGAQVMLLNNDGRWINGTMGKIVSIRKVQRETEKAGGTAGKETPENKEKNKGNWDNKEKENIEVQLETGETVSVGRHRWDLLQVKYSPATRSLVSESIGSFTQFPLRLAWAVTIHKGQGKTFEKVIIDIGKGTFTPGQAYVALSRCTSLEGIVLRKPLEKKHIWMDWRVVKFLTNCQYSKAEKTLSLPDKMALIKEAIKSKAQLSITYLKSNDTKSRRLITPQKVGTMEYLGRTYDGVEAYCHLRKEERVFRVDRILEVKVERGS